MPLSRILVLLLAGLAAVAAIFLARGMSSGAERPSAEQLVEQQAAERDFEAEKVLVAAANMPVGHAVKAEELEWRDWPKDSVNDAFFTQSSLPGAVEDYTGAIARMEIAAGEPITGRKLVNPGEAGFMAAVLEPGMRAVAVPISVETSAGGFILPNDRVDVLLTNEVQNQGAGAGPGSESFITRTILENVRVLAIDQVFKEVEGEQVIAGSTATLELTSGESESLAMADAMGDIVLALRSVADIAYDAPLQNDRNRLAAQGNQNITVYRYGASTQTAVRGN